MICIRDDVDWSEEQEDHARELIRLNSLEKVPSCLKDDFERLAQLYWDNFYSVHETKFFKDRSWLKTEFNELFSPLSN